MNIYLSPLKRKLSCANYQHELEQPQIKISNLDPGLNTKIIKIDDLPDDIFYEIFKYIPLTELNQNISNVSERWNLISSHSMFWRNISLQKNNDDIDTNVACDLFRKANSSLRELTIMNRNDCDTILKEVAKFNKNLVILSMHKCHGKYNSSYINATVIKNIILKLPKLRSLRMFDTQFRSVKFFEIFGSRTFMNLRSKKIGIRNRHFLKAHSITYTGVLTFKQLEAYTRNANTSGKITLNNGQEYTIKKVREILETAEFDPNSVVRTLDNFT